MSELEDLRAETESLRAEVTRLKRNASGDGTWAVLVDGRQFGPTWGRQHNAWMAYHDLTELVQGRVALAIVDRKTGEWKSVEVRPALTSAESAS